MDKSRLCNSHLEGGGGGGSGCGMGRAVGGLRGGGGGARRKLRLKPPTKFIRQVS